MTRHLGLLIARSRTVLCVATAGAATVLVAGCGGATPSGSTTAPTHPGGLSATPSGTPGPTSGNIGDTLVMEDSGDGIAHVTLVKVFDPATGFDPNDTPPDGTRWVGFEGTIVTPGARSGQDDTSVDVIGSDGQTYGLSTSYSLTTFDGCTATDDSALPSGATQTFCWAVGLPPGVTVAKVGYSTQGVEGGSPAVLFWTVPASSAPATTATPSPETTSTPSPATTATPSPATTATPSPATTPSPSPASATASTGDAGDGPATQAHGTLS